VKQSGTGPTFGGPDQWEGLGIILDTFDNDRSGNHPYVGLYYNDGSWKYTPENDGTGRQLGGCKFNYRNYETKIRISYVDGIAQIDLMIPSLGQTEWTYCASSVLQIPNGMYFGATAATGGLTDNHDISSFVVYRLFPKGQTWGEYQQINPNQQKNEQNQQQNQQQTQQTQQQTPPTPTPPVETRQPETPTPKTPPKEEHPETKGIENRQQTVTSTLRRVIHEYEEKDEQPPKQEQPKATTPDLSGSSMGVGTQEAVQGLLKEIQSLKRQQSDLQDNIYSLQTALTSYITAQKRTSEDLNQVISAQRVITDSIDKLVSKTPTKDDLKNVGSSGVTGSSLTDLTRKLDDVKSFLMEKLNAHTNNWNEKIDTFSRILTETKMKVDQTKSGQTNLESNFQRTTQEINQTISESSGFGFWIYFLLFQVIFGMAFMWFKKWKDDKKYL